MNPNALRETLLLTLVIGAFLGFTGHEAYMAFAVPEVAGTRARNRQLHAELGALAARLERSEARLAVARREAEVMREAVRTLREEESRRQQELNRLQADLDFYRGLAGTGAQQEGLAVHQFELAATESPRVFHFVLTLTQNIRRASIVEGKARIDLEGVMDDRPLTVHWADLGAPGQPEPAFRFKYFQQLEGYLAVPERFAPTRLLVTLDAGGGSKPVQRSFDWQEILPQPAGSGR